MPSSRQTRAVSLPCASCGAPFQTRRETRLFCSKACATRERWRGGYRLSPRDCSVCDESFTPRGPAQHVCDDTRCRSALSQAQTFSGRTVEVARLVRSHDGSCDACGEEIAPMAGRKAVGVVDHCHDSGALRGVLHSNCNAGLGMAKDDPERLFAWQVYLARSTFDLRDLCEAA